MKKYQCKIKEFERIPPRAINWYDGVKYRMIIETTVYKNAYQPGNKKPVEIYKGTVSCCRSRYDNWKDVRDDDENLKKVLWEHGVRHVIKELSQEALPKSFEIELDTKDCPYEPTEIKYSSDHTFTVKVKPKIGFTKD